MLKKLYIAFLCWFAGHKWDVNERGTVLDPVWTCTRCGHKEWL